MSESRGLTWWGSLHPWQKMAVVRGFPAGNSDHAIAEELKLLSLGTITGTRRRLKNLERRGLPLPEPCTPEEANSVVIPRHPFGVQKEYERGRKKYLKKPEPEVSKPVQNRQPPLNLEKPRKCCGAGCQEQAVPTLAFCPDCAKIYYKPMTPQQETLISRYTTPRLP